MIAATHLEKSTTKTGALNAVAVDSGAGYHAAPAAKCSASDGGGAACYLRPGDPGFEEREACQ